MVVTRLLKAFQGVLTFLRKRYTVDENVMRDAAVQKICGTQSVVGKNFALKNHFDVTLRIVLGPDSVYELAAGESVNVRFEGASPVLFCEYFVDEDGFNAVSFWPEQELYRVTYKGQDVLGTL